MVSELSILIPVYNFNICPLIHDLLSQCRQAAIRFEIICFDDGSEEKYQLKNRLVSSLPQVIYRELPENISRAAIRNLLARQAQFKFLLFLDNDSGVVSDTFIQKYLEAGDTVSVFIGGTIYQPNPPVSEFRLHWEYGRIREQRSATIRQQHPYKSIQVNNLFISGSLYLACPIPELLQGYGHEDTLWGYQLEKLNIPVRQIDNPVCHLGLEPKAIFLKKTKQAVTNLFQLVYSGNIIVNSPLVKVFTLLKKLHLTFLFYLVYKILKPIILFNLGSETPQLIYLDVFKLGEFCILHQEKEAGAGKNV